MLEQTLVMTVSPAAHLPETACALLRHLLVAACMIKISHTPAPENEPECQIRILGQMPPAPAANSIKGRSTDSPNCPPNLRKPTPQATASLIDPISGAALKIEQPRKHVGIGV